MIDVYIYVYIHYIYIYIYTYIFTEIVSASNRTLEENPIERKKGETVRGCRYDLYALWFVIIDLSRQRFPPSEEESRNLNGQSNLLFFFFEGGGSKVSEMDTHFFKGTVPWGPCPAPFLASVTRQATILYAESSSTMLQDYVKWVSSSGWPGCLPSSCVTRSFFPLSFSTKDDAPIFNDNVNNNNDRGMESKSRRSDRETKKKKKERRGPRAQVLRARLGRIQVYDIYLYIYTHVCVYIYRTEWRVSQRRSPTFLLFSSFPLIANLHRAYAQDDRDNEEKYTTDDARGDRLVLHPSRDCEFHLIACTVVGRRVREHLEIIGPTTDQIFHCTRCRSARRETEKTGEGRKQNSSFNHLSPFSLRFYYTIR